MFQRWRDFYFLGPLHKDRATARQVYELKVIAEFPAMHPKTQLPCAPDTERSPSLAEE